MANFKYDKNRYVFPSKIKTESLEMVRISFDYISVLEMYKKYSSLDKSVTQYVKFGAHDNPIESKEFIEDSIQSFKNGESAGYFINEIEGDDFIGTAGFSPDWEKDIAESGIFLFEPYWGNGYSTERGEAMLELAFEEYEINEWISKCHPENKGSTGAIENYVVGNGGRRVGILPNQGQLNGEEYNDHLYFTLDREQYFEFKKD